MKDNVLLLLALLSVCSTPHIAQCASLSFNGGDQFVQVADSSVLHPQAGITVEAWVKLSNLTGGAIVAKPLGSAKNDSFSLDYNGGVLDGVVNTEGNERVTYNWSPALNRWYHLAFTFDSGSRSLRLFIDGSQVAAAVTSRNLAYDGHSMLIGVDVDDGGYVLPFSGLIDNVRVWSFARSAAEIAAKARTILPSGTQGLLGQWTFSEGQGAITSDSSGQGQTGFLGDGSHRPAWIVEDAPVDVAKLRITRLNTKTFIMTDIIEVEATVTPARPGINVTWNVDGEFAAAHIDLTQFNKQSLTDSSGVAKFTFRPSDNRNLNDDRKRNWTKGDTRKNPPIGFNVTANAVIDNAQSTDRLSSNELGPLRQDDVDTLRQEYYDYTFVNTDVLPIPMPKRSDFISEEIVGKKFNTGNYGVLLSVGLPTKYDRVLAAYRGREIPVVYNGRIYRSVIPNDAVLTVDSAYRNPQRNKQAMSVHPNSSHTRGAALDLKPEGFTATVIVEGRSVQVPIPKPARNSVTNEDPPGTAYHLVVYPTLYAAASRVATELRGLALTEQGAKPILDITSPKVNHIHLQWP